MKKNIEDEEVLEVINEKYMELFPAEKKVVEAILKKPQNVVNYNVADLAKKSDVSVATIVRLCHHLGYEGYYQFRLLLSRDLGKKQHRVKKSGDAFCISHKCRVEAFVTAEKHLRAVNVTFFKRPYTAAVNPQRHGFA